ncbi:MAG: HRDC domain-containing protein, partial [Ginsengibacter sp.]
MTTTTSIQPDVTNTMFRLADQLVNQTGSNIFLTGKAGTGKTTFLKYIRQHCSKRMAVVAPTGVAAINAGGVTIHSFFQLPISPFIPATAGTGFSTGNEEVVNTHSLLRRLRITSEKKALLQELELLIIDEISMVRCDTIDAIDTVLRHVRQRPKEIFGGVQLLFIGDMLQLPPVINDQSWQVLSDFYKSPYFFESLVLKENPPVHIEFNKIYRQSDQAFIDVLNQVRHNEMDHASFEILNRRFQPNFRPAKEEGYIILTTHNHKAREINQKELDLLTTPQFSYAAEITGDFFEKAYPADDMLNLKIGAQVMFIKNDSADKGKRYYNGKIGTITSLEKNKIMVNCAGADDIDVQPEIWENIRYTLNKQTRQIDEEVLGSFKQYPLRLAWAITIHKSQGLTFDKAIIDAGESFSPGQVYVALSRCTTLQGLVLQSRVRTSGLMNDERIINFSRQHSSAQQLENALQYGKGHYHLTLLSSLFDFSNILEQATDLHKYLLAFPSSFNETSAKAAIEIKDQVDNLQHTAVRFQLQLKKLFPEDDKAALRDRVGKAANHFSTAIKPLLDSIIHTSIVTDGKLHAKEVNDIIREILSQFSLKLFLWEDADQLMKVEAFQQRKNVFKTPAMSVNVYAGVAQKAIDSPHPVLHQQLRRIREDICAKKNLPVYIVAGSTTIDEMARYLPQTLEELEKISGFGEVKIKQYGDAFLNVIKTYSSQHHFT